MSSPSAERSFGFAGYQDRKHAEWALHEGYLSVLELKKEGRLGGRGFGIYPMDLWNRIFSSLDPAPHWFPIITVSMTHGFGTRSPL